MITPRISVVMSVFSEPLEWIQESIDSILQQTYTDFEFIIINDNPERKELCDFLTKFAAKDSRMVLIQNETNIGLTKSLNKGLKKSRGEYIARMDADDISLPERFSKQVEFLDKHPETGICGTAIEMFGNLNLIFSYPTKHEDIFLFLETCFAHPTVMYRSHIVKQFYYDETRRVSQDYDLWIRMYMGGVCMANLNEVLLKYRCSHIQISCTKMKMQKNISSELRRKMLNYFLRNNNLPEIDIPVGFHTLDKVKSLQIPLAVKQQLNYYLLLSVHSQIFELMYYAFLKRTIQLSIKQRFGLIYHRVLKHDVSRF